MSDKRYVRKKNSCFLKCKKQTRNKDIHKALTLVNLIVNHYRSKCEKQTYNVCPKN